MELIGRECFDVLAMRSLFQDFNTDAFDEKITSCKMHDIVHDFAQFLRKSDRVEGTMETKTNCQTCDPLLVCNVNEFRGLFLNKKDYSPRLCDCLARLRVLSPKNFFDRRGMENLIHLRWLDLSGNELYVFNLTPIFQLYFLQNLRLSNCGLKEIPREIKNLIHLRHLDLSSNWHLEKLPMEIGNLTQLRCLDLRFNRSLKELPESIWGLQELRVLNITSCERLNRVPEGLARLTSLRTLYRFEGGSGWSKLGLLKKLNHLSGSLDLIVRLGDDEVIKDAREAELRNKTKLRQLFISFKDDMDECKNLVRMDAIDALEPHPNLKHLVIDKYKGSKFPLSWIVSPLSQLTYIALSDCKGLTSLPPLGNLPCLEEIRVFGMESLKHVGREFLGSECLSNALAFPKLKKLKFYECSEWKEWEDITPQEEEVSTIMPCLVELTIENCNSLTMLPCSLLSKAWPVKMLDISGSEELQRHCRDNGVVFMVQPKFFDPTFVTS